MLANFLDKKYTLIKILASRFVLKAFQTFLKVISASI